MTNDKQTTDAVAPTESPTQPDTPQQASFEDKGKGKVVKANDAMDEDDDDDDEEEEEEEEGEEEENVDDEEMEDEDEFQEINAQAILPQGRRTRGVRVDYTSPEALKKAGLDNDEPVEGDEED